MKQNLGSGSLNPKLPGNMLLAAKFSVARGDF